MRAYFECARAVWRYRDYHPQRITWGRYWRWLGQFERADRERILRLLENVVYFSRASIRDILIQQNKALMSRLHNAGLSSRDLIYVQVDDPGSSSPVILNILRDEMSLERRGCHLLDGRDVLGIAKVTRTIGRGALIYVDDFVGSGKQLCDARDYVAANVVGTFSEFALIPAVCEEGLVELGRRGVEVYAGHLHAKAERPLHPNSSLFDPDTKERLIEICRSIDPRAALGFMNGAVMIVLYRGAPDNVPIIFRGSANQQPYAGLFPRYTDLPLRELQTY